MRALAGDYLRAGVGLAIGLGILLSMPASAAIMVIFGSWSVLFGLFAFRTVQRHLTRVAVTETEIRDVGFGTRVLPWGDLKWLKLRYFGTKRQARAQGGFMQLKLRGKGCSLTYDSGLEGFDYIAACAAQAMRANGNCLDPASADNLLSLGVDVDRPIARPEASGPMRA